MITSIVREKESVVLHHFPTMTCASHITRRFFMHLFSLFFLMSNHNSDTEQQVSKILNTYAKGKEKAYELSDDDQLLSESDIEDIEQTVPEVGYTEGMPFFIIDEIHKQTGA